MPGPFDGVPRASGALSYTAAIQKRAERAGIDLHVPPIDLDLAAVSDLGEILFSLVAECRTRGIDPEVALRTATNTHRRAAEIDPSP